MQVGTRSAKPVFLPSLNQTPRTEPQGSQVIPKCKIRAGTPTKTSTVLRAVWGGGAVLVGGPFSRLMVGNHRLKGDPSAWCGGRWPGEGAMQSARSSPPALLVPDALSLGYRGASGSSLCSRNLSGVSFFVTCCS